MSFNSSEDSSLGLLIDIGELNPQTSSDALQQGCGMLVTIDDILSVCDEKNTDSAINSSCVIITPEDTGKDVRCEAKDVKRTPVVCGAKSLVTSNIFSPTEDLQLIENEIFDFDLPITPESIPKDEKSPDLVGDVDEDDEVFFGSVGHTEKCIIVNHELEEKEHKPMSPLNAHQYAEIFKEAMKVVAAINDESRIEEAKKKSSSGNEESLLVKLGKISLRGRSKSKSPETESELLKTEKIIKSPRSPRRETYVLATSPAHERPPAFQKRATSQLAVSGTSANAIKNGASLKKQWTKEQASKLQQTCQGTTVKKGLQQPSRKSSMDSLQRSTIKPAEVKNGIQPPRKTSLTSPQSIKVKQADVMKFTAKSSPQKCKSSLRQNSTSKPSNCSGKSKLALPSSRLPSKSIDNTKSPRLAKREKHSPPKRKRISSAGSEGSISDTCSVSSDVSDCSTTSTGIPGKRLQHKPSLKSSSLKQPIARGYRNPKPFYSTGSESSVDSSNTTLNGSMCKEPTAVKKSSSLVTPGYRQSLIKPGVLPQKKTIPVCRPLKMSTAGSKLSKPQPVKATVPMTHSKTPNKVVNKGTPRPNLSQTQAITSTPKSQRLPRRLPSPVSSVKSASAKTTLPRRPVSANNDRMQCSPMKGEIRKTNVTPQSSRNRRSAIPTPAKSIGKFKLDFSAGLSPSSLQSPVLRKISLADSTYDSVFSEEAEIVPPLPPPSFSPPALTKSENPVFSSPVLCDVNTQDGLPPPHCEEMVKKSIDKQCRNSPAVDTLINISDGNIQNGLSPQICTVSLTKPLIDFGSPLDKENLI